MSVIKSYTNLEQSRKLAEILPLETADMKWCFWKDEIDAPKTPTFGYSKTAAESYKDTEAVYLPCWSLAALLNVMPKDEGIDCSISFGYYNGKGEYIEKWLCAFEKEGETTDDFIIETIDGDNPIDACVNMIIWLKEQNLL